MYASTRDSLKTTRLIGQMCKRGDTFSLLVLISQLLDHNFGWLNSQPQQSYHAMSRKPIFNVCYLIQFLGDFSEGGTPVPIPNTEVKPFSGDGTAFKSVGE
jgi:hypothetical protein